MSKSILHTGPLHITILEKDRDLVEINKEGEIVLTEANEPNYSFGFSVKEYYDEYLELKEQLFEIERNWGEVYIDKDINGNYSKATIDTNNKNFNIYKKEKKKKEDEIKALKKKFEDVRFTVCTVGNGLNLTKNDYMVSRGKGVLFQGVQLKSFLRGGGKVYIEAFHENEEPRLSPPYGTYVSAKGKPRIIKTVWSDCEFKPISKAVKFDSTVLLHIYTADLYGQELAVELWDRDYTSRNDHLSSTDANIENQDPSTKGQMYFTRQCEVNIHKVNNNLDIGVGEISGGLVAMGTLLEYSYVQKAVLQVKASRSWVDSAGSSLDVFPVIKKASVPLYSNKIERNYLEVEENGITCPEPPSSLSAALIGQVVTDVGLFRPCGYYVVTVKEGGREAILYSQYISEITKNFELVAGNKLKEVTISLDDLASTNDCMSYGLNEGETHSDNVFDVSSNISPSPTKSKDNPYAPITITTKGKSSVGYGKASSENKHEGDAVEQPCILWESDQDIIVGVNFNYDKSPLSVAANFGLPYILRYFWFTERITTKYDIHIRSCRLQRQTFKLLVYPDVKWTLQVVFKNKTTHIEIASALSKKYRKKAGVAKVASIGDRDIELSLLAEYNNGDETNITNELKDTIKKTFGVFGEIVSFIENTVLGKNNKDGDYDEPTEDHRAAREEAERRARAEREKIQKEIDKENTKEEKRLKELQKEKERIHSLRQRSQDPNLTQTQREKAERDLQSEVAKAGKKNPSLIRKVVGMSIEWPEVSLGFSWSCVPITNPQFKDLSNTTAMLLEGFIKADPLIKASIYLDFLALAQRAHPVVLAIIAGLDIGLSMFGDGSKIVAELRLEMEIKGEVSGEINMKTGENTFNKEDSEFAKIGGSAALSLTLGIYLKLETRSTYIWVGKAKVKVDIEAEVKAEAKISATSNIGCDDTGFYFAPQWQFEGLCIEGKAKAEGKAEAGKLSISKSGSLNFKYQAIDAHDPVEYGKLYFKNL